MSHLLRLRRHLVPTLLLIAIAACGSSDVGNQTTIEPQAVATVIGYPATKDSAGALTITARTQAEVVLSGKDSVAGDKPILTFNWDAANTAASTVKLVKRNNSTYSFSVPRVIAPTVLAFKLTVTDADQKQSTQIVNVDVVPAFDANETLQTNVKERQDRVSRTFSVVVVPPDGIVPDPKGPDVSFEVTIRKKIRYRRRSDAPAPAPTKTGLADLGVVATVEGKWLGTVGSPGKFVARYENPRYTFAIPKLTADDINIPLQDAPASSADRGDELRLVDMDDADVLLDVSVKPTGSARNVGFYISGGNFSGALKDHSGIEMYAHNDGTTAAAVLANITTDDLLTRQFVNYGDFASEWANQASRTTALNYYQLVDPQGHRKTLSDWLYVNCFDPAKPDYDASGSKGAHAKYTNNFDLGFGRDMYVRTASCGPGTKEHPSEFRDGDVASVVINYPSLEAATKKLNPIIAVAMEYRGAEYVCADHPATCNNPLSGVRTATFYVFAPDDATGTFRRIASANFDGRGEKYVPGVCIACHGEGPAAVNVTKFDTTTMFRITTNLAPGGLFMPWDLKSLLFSDTDPSFSMSSADAKLRSEFTRTAQEPELKKMNLAVRKMIFDYCGNSLSSCSNHFSALVELIDNWYGVDKFDYVPKQWRDGALYGGYTNPAGTEALYLNVLAQHCRACHLQLSNDGGKDVSFSSYQNFISQETDTNGARPYLERRITERVFQAGDQPSSRLTFDRFWVKDKNGQVPAKMLADHLLSALDGVKTPPSIAPFDLTLAPGRPALFPMQPSGYRNAITLWVQTALMPCDKSNGVMPPLECEIQANTDRTIFGGPDAGTLIVPNSTVRLDARAGYFYDKVDWSIRRTPVSAYPCDKSTVPLIGAEGDQPAFLADCAGEYDVSLTAHDDFDRTTDLANFKIIVTLP